MNGGPLFNPSSKRRFQPNLEEIIEERSDLESQEEIKVESSRSNRGRGGNFKGLDDSVENQLIVPEERSKVSSIDISDCSNYYVSASGLQKL